MSRLPQAAPKGASVEDPGTAAELEPERIAAGDLVAEISPAIGGSVSAFYTASTGSRERHDWLRPADASAFAERSALGMASFPLVPWCNRIRDGRFEWNGRTVQLPPNADGSPHTMHGIGWRRPWQVSARGGHWIELEHRDDGRAAWPFAFEALQRHALDAEGLSITLTLRNTGLEPMPAGIGHHPFFKHRRSNGGTVVRAAVSAIWLGDADVLPTALSTAEPAVAALRNGMPIAHFDLDNNFTGFGREATVRWPDASGLRLEATAPLDFFVLYTPADRDIFVMEAVSNCTDWINLRSTRRAAEIGGAALEPGQTLRATTRFVPLRAAG